MFVLSFVFESAPYCDDVIQGKMREMLEDLRIDLGIPASDAEEDPHGVGMLSTWSPKHHTHHSHSNMTSLGVAMRSHVPGSYDGARLYSPDAKPPLPRSQARTMKAPTSYDVTRTPEADVLRIDHSDDVDGGDLKGDENEVSRKQV